MLKNIIVIGNSGNSLAIIDTLFSINKIKKEFKILGILDDKNNSTYRGIKVIDNIKKHNVINNSYYINGIASINSLSAKNNIIKKFSKNRAKFISIFDPTSVVSSESKIVLVNECLIGKYNSSADILGCKQANNGKFGWKLFLLGVKWSKGCK